MHILNILERLALQLNATDAQLLGKLKFKEAGALKICLVCKILKETATPLVSDTIVK